MQYFEKQDLRRLKLLLEYSFEAMNYWFDSCDVSNELISENSHFLKECSYFIDKINEIDKIRE